MTGEAENQNPSEAPSKPEIAFRGRDFGIYGRWMDNGRFDKFGRLLKGLKDKEVPEGAVILDVGSGTGTLAEMMAEAYRGAQVFAVDISQELREMAADKPLIGLIWDDATKLEKIPDNSVDIIYTHTTWHEVFSKYGYAGLERAIAAAFRKLKPGGRFVCVDMVRPTYTGPIFMRINVQSDGVDKLSEATVNGRIDYTKLSTRAIFGCFQREFRGGNAFSSEVVRKNGLEYLRLPAEFGQEFLLHKDYRANFQNEMEEKYLWGTRHEAKLACELGGFTNVKVVYDDSLWIRQNRTRGQVTLFMEDEKGELREVEFPTHMIISADKPGVAEEATAAKLPQVDYDELLKTIEIDEPHGILRIGDKTFHIGQFIGSGAHRLVYENLGHPGHTLVKVVRSDEPDVYDKHNIFKSMTQAIDRQNVLREYKIYGMEIVDYDHAGPPYRYLVQEQLQEGAEYVVDLIRKGKLTEGDVAQIADVVNRFELNKRWQLDMSPFNWARVKLENGETQMVYTGSTVYAYDERWSFARIGLLQWSDAKYVPRSGRQTAVIPPQHEIDEFVQTLDTTQNQTIIWFKKYLSPEILHLKTFKNKNI